VQATEKESNALKGAQFSNHARQRAGQRGVRMTELYLVIAEGDRVTPVGSNCVALAISRERRKELVAEGYPPSVVDRAARLALVESPDGEIITVLHPNGHRGRRYRTPFGTCRAAVMNRHSRAA